jgi:transposase
MKTNVHPNISHLPTKQASKLASAGKEYDTICLGADLHKKSIMVTRIIDHATPQPAQRFTWTEFWRFVAKQMNLAKRVTVVYEAGAFGFWPQRKLAGLGVECYVTHPVRLDPHHKHVQTDKLDSRHLAENLQRYVLGNKKAMVPVYVPTVAEEQARLEARHRRKLHQRLQSLRASGRGLLLSQGIFDGRRWWETDRWEELQPQLCPQLVATLEDYRKQIELLKTQVHSVEKQLVAAAPKELPKGLGMLTFVLMLRELCNYRRFANRRNIGGFTGLCGAVSSSGPYHVDLSINKAGSPYLRTLLIELAWRMVYWQPGYTGLKAWNKLNAAGLLNKRRRKVALVAVARQLAVDLWRWQTERVTAQQLGWEMMPAA